MSDPFNWRKETKISRVCPQLSRNSLNILMQKDKKGSVIISLMNVSTNNLSCMSPVKLTKIAERYRYTGRENILKCLKASEQLP